MLKANIYLDKLTDEDIDKHYKGMLNDGKILEESGMIPRKDSQSMFGINYAKDD